MNNLTGGNIMNELNTKMLKKVYNLVYSITGLQFFPVGGAVRDAPCTE